MSVLLVSSQYGCSVLVAPSPCARARACRTRIPCGVLVCVQYKQRPSLDHGHASYKYCRLWLYLEFSPARRGGQCFCLFCKHRDTPGSRAEVGRGCWCGCWCWCRARVLVLTEYTRVGHRAALHEVVHLLQRGLPRAARLVECALTHGRVRESTGRGGGEASESACAGRGREGRRWGGAD